MEGENVNVLIIMEYFKKEWKKMKEEWRGSLLGEM
jgi:hypothetical protein